MSAAVVDIRIEDMPSLDDVIACQSTFGCDHKATLRWAGHCCPGRRAWVEDGIRFLCGEHFDFWVKRCGYYPMQCQFCHKIGHGVTDFDFWKPL